MALVAYSKHHNRQMKDVKIEEVKDDGGLDKWAPEKEKRFEPPGPTKLFSIQRKRGINWIKGPGDNSAEAAEATRRAATGR